MNTTVGQQQQQHFPPIISHHHLPSPHHHRLHHHEVQRSLGDVEEDSDQNQDNHHRHHRRGEGGEDSTTTTMSMDQAIELLGTGPFQRGLLWAAGLCFAADAMEVLLLSFLARIWQVQWQLTDSQTAQITSVVFVGAMTGTLVLGPAGDRYGRKPLWILTAVIICVFGLGTAGVQHYHTLLLVRFWVGFGVGGLTVPFDTLAEFLPQTSRGFNLLAIEYFWTLGTLLVPLLAWLTLRHPKTEGADDQVGDDQSWRWLVAWCAVPCFLSTGLGLWLVPESPRWLLTQGRSEQALTILRRAAIMNRHPDAWALFPPGLRLIDSELPEHNNGSTVSSSKQSSWCDLFQPSWRRLTLWLWGSWAGLAFTYYGTIMVVTLVFSQTDHSSGGAAAANNNNTATITFDYAAIFTSASAELAGTTLVIWLVDRIGRIRSQIISYMLGGVSVLILCLLAPFPQQRAAQIMAAFGARLFFMSGTCATWISTAEILTTEIRTTGHSAANAVARLAGALSPFLVTASTPFSLMGVVLLLMSFWTAFTISHLPETKGQDLGVGGRAATDHKPHQFPPHDHHQHVLGEGEEEDDLGRDRNALRARHELYSATTPSREPKGLRVVEDDDQMIGISMDDLTSSARAVAATAHEIL